MIVAKKNPLEDLTCLRNLEMVVSRGNIIEKPSFKKNERIELELDKYL